MQGDRFQRLRPRLFPSAILVAALIASAAGLLYWHSYDLDLVIAGGLIVDGTGAAPFHADIAIRDGKIAGISRWLYWLAPARSRLNAGGKVVAPGFIDVHTHIEANLPRSAAFKPANFLKQGVTTLITGNCGRSRIDVAAMLDSLERHGTYINVATLIGHNSLRRQAMGLDARAPTRGELRQMQQLVERGMNDGALGISTGLAYVPGRFASVDELAALARIATEQGGIYASHVRNEASGGEEAICEALT
ncbi:MAG: amidohydrolase family protein, partial [Blastocatellia bacterium]